MDLGLSLFCCVWFPIALPYYTVGDGVWGNRAKKKIPPAIIFIPG